MTNSKVLTFLAILVCLSLIPISYINAATVHEVTMDEMLDQCQFVFEGKVTSLEARKNDKNRIHTYVTFEIQESIKGEYPGATITLSFLGGTVGDVTMAVSDMQLPQVGEHGIYFVESLERPQVHPLYGWSQGHFIVKPDDRGAERVMTSREQPVVAVMSNMQTDQMSTSPKSLPALSKGVARGLTLARENVTQGLTADEFKKILHGKLEKTNE